MKPLDFSRPHQELRLQRLGRRLEQDGHLYFLDGSPLHLESPSTKIKRICAGFGYTASSGTDAALWLRRNGHGSLVRPTGFRPKGHGTRKYRS